MSKFGRQLRSHPVHLIEEYPSSSKEELLSKEKYWIKMMAPSCNMYNPVTTEYEKKIWKEKYWNDNGEEINRKKKKYYGEHREEIKRKQKKYYGEHKEEIKIYGNKYHNEHKEERKIYNDKYRNNNKEEINIKLKEYYENNKEKFTQKILCKCGYNYTEKHKNRHFRTQYHKEIMMLNFELD